MPAITDVRYVEPDGQRQMHVSRVSINVENELNDVSTDPAFVHAGEDLRVRVGVERGLKRKLDFPQLEVVVLFSIGLDSGVEVAGHADFRIEL